MTRAAQIRAIVAALQMIRTASRLMDQAEWLIDLVTDDVFAGDEARDMLRNVEAGIGPRLTLRQIAEKVRANTLKRMGEEGFTL